jgi:hypothetical protein
MGYRSKGLVFAMEEAEVGGEENMVPEVTAEVEAGVAEVESDAGDISEMNDVADDAMADTETLGNIQEVMSDSVESGEGLSEDAAKIAEVAVEAICARLGMKRRVMPAMESFGSKHSRLAATKIAMEGIGDAIKTAWEAVKKFFKMIFSKISDFFMKFFDNTDRIRKYAESLRKTLGEKSGATAKETSVDVGSGVANTFNTDGTFDVQSVNKIFAAHNSYTAATVKSFDILKSVIATIENFVKDSKLLAAGDLAQVVAKIADFVHNVDGGAIGVASSKVGDNEVTKLGPFINGIKVVMTFNNTTGSLSVSQEEPEKKAEKKTIDTLGLDLCAALITDVVKLMDTTDEFKKLVPKIKALNNDFMKFADSGMKMAESIASIGEEGKAKANSTLNSLRATMQSIASASNRIVTLNPAINVRLGKHSLKIVDACLRVYKK